MSNLKISPDLFLGTPELKRFQQFMSTDGYVKGLLNDSVTFGLIKNDGDITFANSKISSDSDINIGGTTFKTIKINPISGFDKNGNFLVITLFDIKSILFDNLILLTNTGSQFDLIQIWF